MSKDNKPYKTPFLVCLFFLVFTSLMASHENGKSSNKSKRIKELNKEHKCNLRRLDSLTGKYDSLKREDRTDTLYLYVGRPDTSTVRQLLIKHKVKHIDIVLRQSIIESGWWKPKINSSWVMHNNTFGFRTSKGYKTFNHLEEGVMYYKWWQDQLYLNPNEDYYLFLDRIGYAEQIDYIQRLKNIKL